MPGRAFDVATFVTAFAGGIPGVVLADGGTGEVDMPGGRSF